MSQDILTRGAAELAHLVADGVLGSRELLALTRARIEREGPALNAVVTTDWERAEREALAADEAVARGDRIGPLHGLPMSIKDSIETEGIRTTSGAPELRDHVPGVDATAVARLRAAGAVVYGKTNVPAWASDSQCFNSLFGTTNNPWDQRRTPSGSSGGAAVAVATGMSTLELGSDLGGSIRMPAHYCGIYGLKPTFGIVSLRGHLPPAPGWLVDMDMAALGPLGRSPDDLELALQVLAGAEGPAASAWRFTLPPPRRATLRDYRIGMLVDDPACPVDAATRTAMEQLAVTLRQAGARVVPLDAAGPSIGEGLHLFRRLVAHLMGLFMSDEDFSAMASEASSTWQRNVTITARDHVAARQARALYSASWDRVFTDLDVVLTPTMPTQAIPHDQEPDVDARRILVDGVPRPYGEQYAWVQAPSAAHLPCAVAPLPTVDGLPMGVQVVGPRYEDATVIDVARRLAQVTGGYRPPPSSRLSVRAERVPAWR